MGIEERLKYRLVHKKLRMGDKKTEIEKLFRDKLMFEYQELREERHRSTTISYSILVIGLAAAGYFYKKESPDYLLAVFFFVLVYVIDRKLTWFNNERAERMKRIESHLEIKNIRLVDTDSWSYWTLIKKCDIKRIVMKIPIHYYYFGVGLLFLYLGYDLIVGDLKDFLLRRFGIPYTTTDLILLIDAIIIVIYTVIRFCTGRPCLFSPSTKKSG